jgi:uncharacterized spore protein YtfJ
MSIWIVYPLDARETNEETKGHERADFCRTRIAASAFLQSLVDRLHSSAKVETVFGASREEGGRTFLPVARVWYGFGGGYSSARKKGESVAQATDEGGGGGIRLVPVGVFEFTERGTRFIPVTGRVSL